MEFPMFHVNARDPGLASEMNRKASSVDEVNELMTDAERLGYTSFFVKFKDKMVFIAQREPGDAWVVKRDWINGCPEVVG
jgi:hypothetical protein